MAPISTHHPRLRTYAALFAIVGWCAVILQFFLSIDLALGNGKTVALGIIVYSGYFTILTNILAAFALTAVALPMHSPLGKHLHRPGVVTAIAACITIVGLTYLLVLSKIWAPQGWLWVADVTLHYVMPTAFVIFWWFAVPRGALNWKDLPSWLVFPLGYLVYVLARGAMIGLYPYPFIDVGVLGINAVLVNSLLVLLAFIAVAALLIVINNYVKPKAVSDKFN